MGQAERRGDTLLRFQEVSARTGLPRTTIYRRIDAGTFPRQLRLSVRAVAWYESDIADWVADPAGWKAAA